MTRTCSSTTAAGLMAFGLTVVGAACAEPYDDVGGSRAPLTGFLTYERGCIGDCADLNLGPHAGRTCFLAGIDGSLGPSSRVEVEKRADGNYWLDVFSTHGVHLKARAVCIPGDVNRTNEYLTAGYGSGATSIPSGTSDRRCFLTSIVTGANAFALTTDQARVSFNVFTGWTVSRTQQSSAYSSIGATCVDVPDSVASGSMAVDGPIASGGSGPASWVACGMTGLRGPFRTVDDEALLDYQPLSPPPDAAPFGPNTWGAIVSNENLVWYNCVR